MRITTRQLRRIIMEEVAASKRQKSLQETRRRRAIAARRRRMNESPYANVITRPKETAKAALVLVGILTVLSLTGRLLDGQAEKDAEIMGYASTACDIAAESGDLCDPDVAIEQAKAHLEANEGLGMSRELDQSYSPESDF